MANNPYMAAPSRPNWQDEISAESKAAWNRFWKINSRMRKWHFEGKLEKVNASMWKWERFNRQAWGFGWEVPDHFNPAMKPKFMHRRNTQ